MRPIFIFMNGFIDLQQVSPEEIQAKTYLKPLSELYPPIIVMSAGYDYRYPLGSETRELHRELYDKMYGRRKDYVHDNA